MPPDFDNRPVAPERTGWRDEAISRRHREWGFNCPAVDLDFLVAEYNRGLPVALVEYKHFKASQPVIKHPTYRALTALADGYNEGPLPFIIAFYWPEIWAFRVWPINQVAKTNFQEGEFLTEFDFVARLYQMRRLVLARDLIPKLNRLLPEEAAA